LNDERIKEIIISDDNSNDYEILEEKILKINNEKIKLYKNKKNLKCYTNKYLSVSRSSENWVILLDSDNIIKKDYLDVIYQNDWKKDTIYCPEKALPNFIYSNFLSLGEIDKKNANHFNLFQYDTLLNTCNYFFNKEEYVKIWNLIEFDSDLTLGVDTIFFNTNWIKFGNKLKVIKNLEYNHTVRNDGDYSKNSKDAGRRNDFIINSFLNSI
jgi:glycosyltransferase involved in cell wall biosynthesis